MRLTRLGLLRTKERDLISQTVSKLNHAKERLWLQTRSWRRLSRNLEQAVPPTGHGAEKGDSRHAHGKQTDNTFAVERLEDIATDE